MVQVASRTSRWEDIVSMIRIFSSIIAALALAAAIPGQTRAEDAPKFEVEPFWPKPLPKNWILGQVAGIAVDRDDHIWIVHRPATLVDDEKGAMQDPPTSKCCTPAAPVLEFDTDGNLLRAWGGPGEAYDWPKMEHGIFVDKDGNVWIAGNDASDHPILKFPPDGKFLQQIGKAGSTCGADTS